MKQKVYTTFISKTFVVGKLCVVCSKDDKCFCFLFNKDELSNYVSNLNVSNMAMKLRKAALKARHQKELNDLRNRMQKEIDQSIKELKMTSDIRRMQAVEAQVNVWLDDTGDTQPFLP